MILKELHQETARRTREDAQKHSTRLLIIGSSMSVLFTLMFYVSGIFEHDPRYKDVPLALSLGVMLLQNWIAVMITQIGLTYLKCFGKTTCSRVIDWYPNVVFGFWNFVDRCYGKISDFILSERIKQKISDSIWEPIKLHKKYDPIYKADLEAMRQDFEAFKIQDRVEKDTIEDEQQRQLERMNIQEQKIRIKDLVIDKLRKGKSLAEWERDQERRKRLEVEQERDEAKHDLTMLENDMDFLTSMTFRFIRFIRKLKGE